MAAAGTAARLRFAGIAVLVLTLIYAIASILAVPRSTEPFTTYAGATYAHASTAAHAAELAAGLGLLSAGLLGWVEPRTRRLGVLTLLAGDRKSTRLNSSHRTISYAVFCLKKKTIYNYFCEQHTTNNISKHR